MTGFERFWSKVRAFWSLLVIFCAGFDTPTFLYLTCEKFHKVWHGFCSATEFAEITEVYNNDIRQYFLDPGSVSGAGKIFEKELGSRLRHTGMTVCAECAGWLLFGVFCVEQIRDEGDEENNELRVAI